jgi:Xaa-Pro aminopeptidase
MKSEQEARLARLRQALAARDLRALVISKPENRRYFSGFTGEDSGADTAGVLVVGPHSVCLVTDRRYAERAAEEAPGLEVVTRVDYLDEAIGKVLNALGVYTVGFESEHLTDLSCRALSGRSGGAWSLVPTVGIGDTLRAVKDETEIDLTRQAAALTDAAFSRFLEVARPGVSERAIAWELERFMRENGAGLAFEVSVAAGLHAAMPHAPLSDRPLGPGEPVIVDMGARVGGYCADMTRTVLVGGGSPDQVEHFERIYGIVLKAQEAAMATLHAGMSGREADAVARSLIEAAGHGEEFSHGLGHGVGLEIHERPSLRHISEEVLDPGMLVTIEPGIYQPGWGGVRIEDLAVVRPDGLERLSMATKDRLVI